MVVDGWQQQQQQQLHPLAEGTAGQLPEAGALRTALTARLERILE